MDSSIFLALADGLPPAAIPVPGRYARPRQVDFEKPAAIAEMPASGLYRDNNPGTPHIDILALPHLSKIERPVGIHVQQDAAGTQ